IEPNVPVRTDYAGGMRRDRQEGRLGERGGPAVDAYAEKAHAGGVALVRRGLDADLVVNVDGQRLRRVFVNVISNALEATEHRPSAKGEGALYRRGRPAGGEITDNGEGVPPEA